MRIENKKALTTARFPGSKAQRLTPAIVTVCQLCPGKETVKHPGFDAEPVATGVEASDLDSFNRWSHGCKTIADYVNKERAKLEDARTFETRKDYRAHIKAVHP